MKKLVVMLTVLCLTVALAACGEAAAVDTEALSQYVLEQVTFADKLAEIAPDAIVGRYQIGEEMAARAWLGSGATAEEFAVFQAADAKEAKALQDLLEQHIADMRESFSSYLPAETEKIDRAVLRREGNTLILLICDDTEGQAKLDAYFAR